MYLKQCPFSVGNEILQTKLYAPPPPYLRFQLITLPFVFTALTISRECRLKVFSTLSLRNYLYSSVFRYLSENITLQISKLFTPVITDLLTIPALYFTSSREQSTFRTVEEWRQHTRVGTLILATIYLQLIQNRYVFRNFTVLRCSHQHCVQPVAMDVEVVGYL